MADYVPDEAVPDPAPGRMNWREFVEAVIEADGMWMKETAATENSAYTAGHRLRGRGNSPLVDQGYFDVRVEGTDVFARISPDHYVVVEGEAS